MANWITSVQLGFLTVDALFVLLIVLHWSWKAQMCVCTILQNNIVVIITVMVIIIMVTFAFVLISQVQNRSKEKNYDRGKLLYGCN